MGEGLIVNKESYRMTKMADQKQFRIEVFVDVNAADNEDAKGQVEEMIVAIPNSYVGDITDMSNKIDLFGEDGRDDDASLDAMAAEVGAERDE